MGSAAKLKPGRRCSMSSCLTGCAATSSDSNIILLLHHLLSPVSTQLRLQPPTSITTLLPHSCRRQPPSSVTSFHAATPISHLLSPPFLITTKVPQSRRHLLLSLCSCPISHLWLSPGSCHTVVTVSRLLPSPHSHSCFHTTVATFFYQHTVAKQLSPESCRHLLLSTHSCHTAVATQLLPPSSITAQLPHSCRHTAVATFFCHQSCHTAVAISHLRLSPHS